MARRRNELERLYGGGGAGSGRQPSPDEERMALMMPQTVINPDVISKIPDLSVIDATRSFGKKLWRVIKLRDLGAYNISTKRQSGDSGKTARLVRELADGETQTRQNLRTISDLEVILQSLPAEIERLRRVYRINKERIAELQARLAKVRTAIANLKEHVSDFARAERIADLEADFASQTGWRKKLTGARITAARFLYDDTSDTRYQRAYEDQAKVEEEICRLEEAIKTEKGISLLISPVEANLNAQTPYDPARLSLGDFEARQQRLVDRLQACIDVPGDFNTGKQDLKTAQERLSTTTKTTKRARRDVASFEAGRRYRLERLLWHEFGEQIALIRAWQARLPKMSHLGPDAYMSHITAISRDYESLRTEIERFETANAISGLVEMLDFELGIRRPLDLTPVPAAPARIAPPGGRPGAAGGAATGAGTSAGSRPTAVSGTPAGSVPAAPSAVPANSSATTPLPPASSAAPPAARPRTPAAVRRLRPRAVAQTTTPLPPTAPSPAAAPPATPSSAPAAPAIPPAAPDVLSPQRRHLIDIVNAHLTYRDIYNQLPEDHKKRMDKNLAQRESGNLSPAEEKYGLELQQIMQDPDRQPVLAPLCRQMMDQLMKLLADLGVPDNRISPWAKSRSWAVWDVAKQSYLFAHPGESGTNYRVADPFEDATICQEIVDRMFGWEIARLYRDIFSAPQIDDLLLRERANPNVDEVRAFLRRDATQKPHSWQYTMVGKFFRELIEQPLHAISPVLPSAPPTPPAPPVSTVTAPAAPALPATPAPAPAPPESASELIELPLSDEQVKNTPLEKQKLIVQKNLSRLFGLDTTQATIIWNLLADLETTFPDRFAKYIGLICLCSDALEFLFRLTGKDLILSLPLPKQMKALPAKPRDAHDWGDSKIKAVLDKPEAVKALAATLRSGKIDEAISTLSKAKDLYNWFKSLK